MKLTIAMILAGLFTVSAAHAKKSPKPVTCLAWKETKLVIEGFETPVAICTDRASPVILTTYRVVEILDEGGVKMPAVVGWK